MADKHYEELIAKSHENLVKIERQVNELDKLYDEIKAVGELQGELPTKFDNWYQQYVKINKEYRKQFETGNTSYIEANNKMFASNLEALSKEKVTFTKALSEENGSFLQKFNDATEQKLTELKTHLANLEGQKKVLQKTGTALQAEVDRISDVDLEAHFLRHSKDLTDVIGTVNIVNTSIAGLSSNLQAFKDRLEHNQGKMISHLTDMSSKVDNSEKRLMGKIAELENQISQAEENAQNSRTEEKKRFTILAVIGVLIFLAVLAFGIMSL